jgi:methionyl-tRNA formyltransferase
VRLVFLGTPVDAVPPLRALVEAGHEVALVLTQPDRRRSRGGGDDPSPVKQAATELGIPVLTPTRARESIADVAASGAQLGVVVGFGQLLPPAFLDALPHGFVNLHYSLLPRWRGAAPVERAILAGDTETGVCLMRIEEGLDTGGVYASVSTPIEPEETAGELHARLTALGMRLLVEHLPLVPETEAGDGEPGVVRRPGELVTTAGVLRLDEVQPEGKSRMTGRAWMAGLRERALPVEAVDAS